MWVRTAILVTAIGACVHHYQKPVDPPLEVIFEYDLEPPIPYSPPKTSWHSPLTASEQEERLIALTIWGEARDQGEDGMHAVASVIINRARADLGKRYGSGLTGVVWHLRQFSCWNPKDPNREAMRHITQLPHDSADWIKWVQAKGIAKMVMHGTLSDNTNGATYYHTGTMTPSWEKEMKLVRVIGSHRFYKRRNE